MSRPALHAGQRLSGIAARLTPLWPLSFILTKPAACAMNGHATIAGCMSEADDNDAGGIFSGHGSLVMMNGNSSVYGYGYLFVIFYPENSL